MIPGNVDGEMLPASAFQAAGKVLKQWLSDGQQEPDQCYQNHLNNFNSAIAVIPCDSSASSTEHDDATADLASLMEVDEEIGENLLGDEVFGGPCEIAEDSQLHFGYSLSAVSHEDETLMNSISAMNMEDDMSEEDRRFLAPLLVENTLTSMDYDAGYIVTDDEVLHQPCASSPSAIVDQQRYQEIMKKLEASMNRSQETRKSLTMKTPKTEKYNRRRSITGVLSSIESSSRQLQNFLQTVKQRKQRTPV